MLARALVCAFAAVSISSAAAACVRPTRGEMDEARAWVDRWLGPRSASMPFSFVYGGRASADLLPVWHYTSSSHTLDSRRTQYVREWTDPETGLRVQCVATAYRDFPTVEWTLYFHNEGSRDTPVLEQMEPLHIRVPVPSAASLVIHSTRGSQATASDYAPVEKPLPAGGAMTVAPEGGRPTNGAWPYFNLDWGGAGMIAVIGWPGQWTASFHRGSDGAVAITGGEQLTHFTLHPGETVRTPLIVLQAWRGDWLRAQNLWRRWMMAHNMPRPGGRLPHPLLVASSSRAYEEMKGANEANQILFIHRYVQERIRLDYWWMDAGWYVQQRGWPQVGTWEVDRSRFPRGFKPISDYAHARGEKILVWFEPERVAADTWLTDRHPEWILGDKKGGLLNLGDPDARRWLTDHIDRLITDNGIDLYRQDFNIDPLPFWRAHDAPDRQGITEIEHVTGYLAFWDELRRRHPDMLIDSCASGGRRNDLETMRRAVPLWRSDYAYEPIGHQCMTYGISMWLPFHGTGTVAYVTAPYYGSGVTPVQPYAFWSNAAPSLGLGFDVREKGLDYPAIRRLVAQWRKLSKFYYGDYYPLTPYSQADDAWIAWQFNRPGRGDGAIQVFRRPKCTADEIRLHLHDLNPAQRYVFRSVDGTITGSFSGRDLMAAGLPVRIAEQPGAAVILYRTAR